MKYVEMFRKSGKVCGNIYEAGLANRGLCFRIALVVIPYKTNMYE